MLTGWDALATPSCGRQKAQFREPLGLSPVGSAHGLRTSFLGCSLVLIDGAEDPLQKKGQTAVEESKQGLPAAILLCDHVCSSSAVTALKIWSGHVIFCYE